MTPFGMVVARATTIKAHTIIRREYGTSANVVTPRVLSYSLIAENVAVEMSEGESKNQQPIFGVSVAVLRPDGTTFRVSSRTKTAAIRSGVFGSRAAANAHVAKMREHLLFTAPSMKGDNS